MIYIILRSAQYEEIVLLAIFNNRRCLATRYTSWRTPESGNVYEQSDRGVKTFRSVQALLYFKAMHSLHRAALGAGNCCLLCGLQWLMQQCAITFTLMTPSQVNAMIETLCNYISASPSRVCNSPRPLHCYYRERKSYIYNVN